MALSTLSLRLRELLSPISIEGAARYTATDVRSLLDGSTPESVAPENTAPLSASSDAATEAVSDSLEARRDAVLEVAARASAWTGRLSRQQAWELGRLADRLPTLVALYSRGTPLEELARREGCLTASTVERALDVACACIAEHLNNPRSADARLVA